MNFSSEIDLDGFIISNSSPTYFIAEIGGNFQNFEMAKRLIDNAKEAGVNAVKFQTLEAETITTKNNLIGFNDEEKASQYENFLAAETPKELQIDIVKYAKEVGLTVFSAPSHMKDVEFMEAHLDIPIYKIGSDLATHIPLLVEVAKIGKPIILSTGLSFLEEVRESVEAIFDTRFSDLILLHCISNYPAQYNEINLKAIQTLKKEFGCIVGYSDHTLDIEISLAATLLGAKVIERHFTYDKTLKGPDHILSSTKDEFKRLINYVRNIETAMGDGVKKPSANEMLCRDTNMVSIIVMEDLEKGDILTPDVLDIRRPGSGIKAGMLDKVVGKKVTQRITQETPLQYNMFEE